MAEYGADALSPAMAAGAGAPRYYKPSGRFNVVNTFTALAAGLIAAIVLGLIEGIASRYSPLIYLTVVIPIGLGFALGWVASRLLQWSRVRNAWLPVLFTAILSAAALYAAWAVWLVLMLPKSFLGGYSVPGATWMLASHPDVMWLIVSDFAEVGVWTIGRSGDPVRGPMLVLFWIAEALIVFGVAVVYARSQVRSRPFCENCLTWTTVKSAAARLGDGDSAAVGARLEAGDLKALEELGPADLSHPNRHVVDLCRCTGCGGLHTLRFAHITHVVNKEGKLEQHRRPVVHDLLLTAEQADWIEEMGQRVGVIDSEGAAGGEGEPEGPQDDAEQVAEAGTGEDESR